MRILFFLFCLSLVLVARTQTTLSGTIQSGSLTRDYLLYVPAAYTGNTPVPLIFNLHGYGSNNQEQLFYGDFRGIADTANFLIVLPNGTMDGAAKRFWNTFNTGATVDDVAFIADLITQLEGSYNIDPNRIYSTGMSNGGFMSYTLACELNDRITAIASVAGDMTQTNLNACNPQRPVPVMEVHGDADMTVPYTGAVLNGFVPIPTLVAAWVGFNHCNTTPTITNVPNNSTTDGTTTQHYVYNGGDQGSTVEHYKVLGGGHTWPGTIFNVGVTSHDFSASQEIWRFFRPYRLNTLTATKNAERSANWSVFPNPAQDYVVLHGENQQIVQRIQVFDAAGQLQRILVPAVNQEIRITTSGWKKGVYFLLLDINGKMERVKLVLEN